MAKSMTLRLSEDMASDLEMVARVKGTSVAHSVRLALARYLAGLADDPEFQGQLTTALEGEQRILLRLGGLDN